jgi:hypothetical protein
MFVQNRAACAAPLQWFDFFNGLKNSVFRCPDLQGRLSVVFLVDKTSV